MASRRREKGSSSSAPPLPITSLRLDREGWVKGSRFVRAAYLRELAKNEELMGINDVTRLVTLPILTRYGLELLVQGSRIPLFEYKEEMIREDQRVSDSKVFSTLHIQAILRSTEDLSGTTVELSDLPLISSYVYSTLGSNALTFITSLLVSYHESVDDENVRERIIIFATASMDLIERSQGGEWVKMP